MVQLVFLFLEFHSCQQDYSSNSNFEIFEPVYVNDSLDMFGQSPFGSAKHGSPSGSWVKPPRLFVSPYTNPVGLNFEFRVFAHGVLGVALSGYSERHTEFTTDA